MEKKKHDVSLDVMVKEVAVKPLLVYKRYTHGKNKEIA